MVSAAASVLALVVLAWLLPKLARYVRRHYYLAKLPAIQFHDRHWLLGNFPSVVDRVKVLYEVTPRYTQEQHRIRRFEVGLFRAPAVMVSDPETVAEVLRTASPKHQFAYSNLLPFIGDGLLLSSGTKWARDRRLLTNAFHFNILQEYTPLLHDSCQVLLEKLAQHVSDAETQNKAFDFSEACCLLTLDVILRCTMGYESNCQLQESEYTVGVRAATDYIVKRMMSVGALMPNFIYFMTKDGANFKKICDMCHEFSAGIIERRVKELEEDGSLAPGSPAHQTDTMTLIKKGKLSFVDILLTLKDEDGTSAGLSNAEIRDQVDTFLFEGHDTTSSAMQWMFYYLAKHPDIQEKCRQEAVTYANADGFVSHEDLGKLKFINQCIKEGLRMTSTVSYIERQTMDDMYIGGYFIPANSIATVDIFSLHHNPSVYPDPYTFDPSRFSEENAAGRHPHALAPFSAGPRNCIGQALAMNELRMTVASVLVRFDLAVDPSLPEPLYNDALIVRAENGINLRVKSR
eukprot:scpid44196/ scgid7075/ Leukotriene-B4 omega-hydroxylase 3; Cyp4f-14; Cytochrome P450 4F14; Cytochrome P450-LTB-omega; Leukotriene-B4 20-monooxygenase 3